MGIYAGSPTIFKRFVLMRNIMRKLSFTVLLLTISMGLYAEIGFAQRSSETLPVWAADPSLLSQLGEIETIEGFTFRPPKGFKYTQQLGYNGEPVHGWVGEPRADGTRPQFVMLTFPISYEVQRADLDPGLAELLKAYEAKQKDWKRGSIEHGLIGGVYFVRTRWEGFDVSIGRKLYGFSYLAVVDKRVVNLSSQDVEQFQASALPLAEAAAFTFRKK